jgi:acyl transferase domain-containing protein/thioesterase domain-containing protein
MEAMDIAVIGLAGRFPGANNPEEFWRNLHEGVESVVRYSDEQLRAAGVGKATLRNRKYVKTGAPLQDMEQFDAGFFGFSPRDAAIMDPQHRHFLEVAWEALENAGHPPEYFPGAVGVFAGSGMHAYLPYNLLTNPALINSVGMFLIRHTGNDKDFLTTRLSYLLNLQGPSVNVQAACSTSLVAIHMASQSLLIGECDMALAGGVTIEVPHRRGYLFEEGEILSSDGHCRAFDAASKGTIFGSGAGVVVLRRLEEAIADGDHIHAVIKGSAVNNDGSQKVGYLAPSVDGQAKAVAEALAIAGVPVETITYVEAHGTGTPVGDPIEVAALTQAFRGAGASKTNFCQIGSAKTNIGHLDTAAGVAGFIKTVLALEHKQIPASLHFERPNPAIDFVSSPFSVSATLHDWRPANGAPRRAGVNSLGVGGTNAFAVLEEAPPREPSTRARRPYHVLTLSARSDTALDRATTNLVEHLEAHPEINLADVAYTTQVGRRAFSHRRAVAVRDRDEALALLRDIDPKRVFGGVRLATGGEPTVVFSFPGGGAQYPNAGRDLYDDEPVYHEQVDLCLRLLAPHSTGPDLRGAMFPSDDGLDAAAHLLERPSVGLPALFITAYALAKQWQAWGIQPATLTGHSLGEYVAACLAGVLSLEDALQLVLLRGELFETLPEGAMLSVRLPEDQLLAHLEGTQLSIAALNAPGMCLVSGEVAAIEALEQVLNRGEVEHSRLKINVAAHSAMLDPILEEFGRRVATFTLSPPQIPYVSNLTGTWITPAEATDPAYYVRHLRQPVRFADGMQTLLGEGNRVLLEVGPGQTLTSLARQQQSAAQGRGPLAFSSTRHAKEVVSDTQVLLGALARLWLAGVDVDWSALHRAEVRHRVPLPTYPFEHQRYWIEPGQSANGADTVGELSLDKMTDVDDWFYCPTWVKAALPPRTAAPTGSLRWLVFLDRRGLGGAVGQNLESGGHEVITVATGPAFARQSANAYIVAPDEPASYRALMADLAARGKLPQRVAHLWSVWDDDQLGHGTFDDCQALGFSSLLYLAQALGAEDAYAGVHIGVISNQLQSAAGAAVIRPERATLFGPTKVMPRELPGLNCIALDVALPGADDLDAVANHIIEELVAAAPTDTVVAIRGQERWIERFDAAAIDPAVDARSHLRENGVYLITGGLGDLGMVHAEYLARAVRARLVLVSRTGLPAREDWDAWLARNPSREGRSRKIQQIRALEATGAEVLVLVGDVADPVAMRTVLDQAKQRFGQINGVLHAAGILDDGALQLKSGEAAARVLAPKVNGALVLDALFAEQTGSLDFFVAFSSTSSILGLAGQVDYAAANAFLNAFAHSRALASNDTRYIAVDWGIWAELGMAARAARGSHGSSVNPSIGLPPGEAVRHPLLGVRTVDELDEAVFRAQYRTDALWMLNEHRVADGAAVVPGTAYLEVARAAICAHEGTTLDEPIEIRDVVFMTPLVVGDEQIRDVQITLKAENDHAGAYAFSMSSADGEDWEEHARAVVSLADCAPPQTYDVAAIRARCDRSQTVFGPGEQHTQQEKVVRFGPRWKVLRSIHWGSDEALATLDLAPEFQPELHEYAAYPPLLDLATAFALPLIEGYEAADDFYVPFSYERVLLRGPLQSRLYSYAKLRPGSVDDHQNRPVFDVVILDEAGAPLIEADGFCMKRVAAGALTASLSREARPSGPGGGRNLLDLGQRQGILPIEGVAALDRILATPSSVLGPQVVVTSIDLDALVAEFGARASTRADPPTTGQLQSRPELGQTHAAPRNEVELKLAAFWRELLGLDHVGIDDDFFELGGYSLIAVRLFAKIKKTFGIELGLETLFRAPTIATCAQLLADELGIDLAVTTPASRPTAVAPTQPSKPPVGWSPLVAIQVIGSKSPFFCVHGAGGNVLNLRDLSRRMGDDQPFYAFQMQGVDGKLPPLRSIEDMAAQYLVPLREVQPHGPYLLGGYSGGGVIALEMAQWLRADGEEVALLAFLDTFCPVRPKRAITHQPVYRALRWRPTWWPGFEFGYKRARINWHISRGEPVPHALREFALYDGYLTAQQRYKPSIYAGSATLFRAEEMDPALAWVGSSLGWQPYIAGGLEIKVIPGNHQSLVLEPNVQVLVSELLAALDRAGGRSLDVAA